MRTHSPRSPKEEVQDRMEELAIERDCDVEDLTFEDWEAVFEEVMGLWEYQADLYEESRREDRDEQN